jgi:hypothetical protein
MGVSLGVLVDTPKNGTPKMAISDSAIRAAKPKDKPYKLSDDEGLFLLIAPSGSKLWRLKYRFGGQEKLLSFGAYPTISLKDARERRDEARKQLANHVDPGVEKKRKAIAAAIQAGNTFGNIAREFLDKLEKEGIAPATKIRNDRCLKQLENELGKRPVTEIEPVEVLAVLKKFERRGIYETAKRLYTAPDWVTDIALQGGGEQLIAISAGDTARWVIGNTHRGAGADQVVHILVKPQVAGLATRTGVR